MRARSTAGYRHPMASTEPMPSIPAWERRFRAPILSLPAWAADDPERMILGSTESGSYQLHAWDRRAGVRRQVTFDPVGHPRRAARRADGTGVVWFHDATGAETGAWVVAPFDEAVGVGAAARGRAARAGPRASRSAGAGPSPASAVPTGFSVWIADGDDARAQAPRARAARAPGRAVARRHRRDRARCPRTRRSWRSASARTATCSTRRCASIDATTGEVVGELRDEGRQLAACGFSPIPGDARLAITHERTGEERPAVWDAAHAARSSTSSSSWSGRSRPSTGGRTAARCSSSSSSRGATASTATTSTPAGIEQLDTEPRLDHRGRRPPRRRGLVPRPSRRAPGAASSRPARRRRCSRPRARPRRSAATSSRGGSRTPMGRGSTASSSGPRARARTR